MLTETDPLGHTTAYTYDGDGNVLTETDPLGQRHPQHLRDDHARLLRPHPRRPAGRRSWPRTTDPLGQHDDQRLRRRTATCCRRPTPPATSPRFAYDAAGNQTSITDAAGNVTPFEYDARRQPDAADRRPRATRRPTPTTPTATSSPQTTTLTTPAGVRTLVTTTDVRRQRPADRRSPTPRGTSPAPSTTRSATRRPTIDALGRRTEFRYDDRGQLVETIFADGTDDDRPAYDAAGRRDRRRPTAAGRTTQLRVRRARPADRDDLPRRHARRPDADNPRTRTEYDAAGQVTAQIDELGNRTEFEYDAAGRQTVVRDALGHETTHRPTTPPAAASPSTDALGHTTQLRLRRRSAGWSQTDLRRRHHARARPTTPSAGWSPQTDQLGRDDRATSTTRSAGSRPSSTPSSQRTEYGYDEAGNLVTQTDANGHVTRYEYDGLGRRTATVLPLGQRSTTAYDAVGNVASTTDFNGDTITYDYDASNRLTAKHFPDGTSVDVHLHADRPAGRPSTDARGTTDLRLRRARPAALPHRPRRHGDRLHLRRGRQPHVGDDPRRARRPTPSTR